MNVRIQYPVNFNVAIFYGGRLRMNNFYARLFLTTNVTDIESQNIALDRLKHFVYAEMDSTVFINSFEQEFCQMYVDCGLNVTTLPGEPVDQLIGIMLYYKLNAIMEGRIIVTDVEISSTLSENVTYCHSENENVSVDIAEWWDAADLIHCDEDLFDEDKVVNLHRVGAWRELELHWPTDDDEETTDNTVAFGDLNKDE